MSKLRCPLVRAGTVRRLLLIERLARADHPIVSVVAPAGYGKTTLLSQWAEANGQAFAWVSVEEPDNDPKVLLTYVAEALDQVEPVGERVFAALASPGSSVPGSVVPRLGAAFASMTAPVALILDDVHVLHDPECRLRDFMTRTAVLERMCGPLCEEVLELRGSAPTLEGLAASNLLLVPLDRHGQWYRYHHLFRDMLLAELQRREAGLIPVLQQRAAAWCLRNGLPEEALEYAIAAGDVGTAARLAGGLAVPTYRQGRVATLQRWFRWLDERGGIEAYPLLTVFASLLAALTARPVEAERWADMVDRWQDTSARRPADPAAAAWAALLRALLCRLGVEQMSADADEAARRFAAASAAEPAPLLLQGIARVLSGNLDGGDACLQDAASAAGEFDSPDVAANALCQRSLLAMARGQWSQAEVFAGQVRTAVRQAWLEESYLTPLVCAVLARAAVYRGDVPAAQRELVSAQRLRPLLTYALPYLALQARLELARAHLALADLEGARTLLREIDELLRRRPGLGTLVGEARVLRDQLSRERGSNTPGPSALTAAELRLLPMLCTHLSFPEIAAEMFLSRYTVKSQAFSIYRKLGVSSRSQAVARARDLGLLA